MSTTPEDDDRTVLRPKQASTSVTGRQPAPPSGESGNALPPGTLLGEFELTGVVGEGGFGIVYLAHDRSLQRDVAVKEYLPSSLAGRNGSTGVSVKSERYRETFELGLKSFINEAVLLAQFDHPSLVKVYRFWEANGTAYMVMPFYQGATLKQKLLEMTRPPDEEWLLGLLAPLTEALSVIHAEHCFHRDIAPDNIILLASSGRPLLLDFGAARRVIGDMTQALTVILKPGYAPVEQYAEVPSMKQGPWTDVYALGAVVYFAIMGRTPPPSVGRMMSDDYVPLVTAAAGRYSVRLLQAIDHALRVRPEDRTPSVAELRSELGLGVHVVEPQETRPHAFGDSVGPDRIAAAPTSRVRDGASSRPAWGIGMGVLALAGVGFGAYHLLMPTPNQVSDAPGSSAPPQTPPTIPQVMPPRPFMVAQEFERVLQAQTSGFRVVATPRQPQLRVSKDRLSFNIKSERDGFFYVLVKGSDGSLILLMPNKTVDNNKIRAGQSVGLPPATWPLDTFEPVGREDFLVIVSRYERDFSHLASGQQDGLLVLRTGEAAAEIARAYSGSGSMLSGRASCAGGGCDEYGAAVFSVDIVR